MSGIAGRAGAGVQQVTKSAKQHPVATAAIGAGVGLMLVEGVRRALKSRGGGQDEQGAGGGRDESQNAMNDQMGAADDAAGSEAEDSAADEEEDDEAGEQDEDEDEDDDTDAEASGESDDEGEESEGDEDDEQEEDDDTDARAEQDDDEGDDEGDDDDQADQSYGGGGGGGGGGMRQRLSRVGSVVGQAAHGGFQRGKEFSARSWQDHPLFICVAALAAGVAAGMLLPGSPAEDRTMGKASDRITGRLRNAAQDLLGQGREVVGRVVSEATDTVTREAEREGLTPDRLGKKVKRVVSQVRQAVNDAIEE